MNDNQIPPVYSPPPAPTPPPPAPVLQPVTPKGLAIAALIVGIVAFLVGLVPVLGIIAGLAGLALGIIALVKKQPKALALTGTILAGVALIASCFTTAGLSAAVDSVSKEITKSEATEAREGKPVEPTTPEATPEPEEKPEPAPKPEPEPEPKERLTLDDGWEAVPDEFGYSTSVNGYVSNNSDKAITNYVQITFDTYDAAGANLGTCLANTNTIDANGKWKFEAMCFDTNDEIAEVKFKEITGF